jgi:hypothetical protein
MADTPVTDEKQQRISYNSCLPSSSELNVLLLGPSDLCQPLASALLRVQFDRPRWRRCDNDDAAVAALRRPQLKRKRHVHMSEDWNTFPHDIRMDHIVLVVSPSDIEPSLTLLKKAASVLDASYVTLQRVSVVLMMDPVHGLRDAEPLTSFLKPRKRNEKRLFGAPVPCFPCQLQERSSHLAVSRILLQRTKLGTRHGSRSTPFTSPLVFANYAYK